MLRDELRRAALEWHDRGYFVIPCHPDTKIPLIKWGRDAVRPSRAALQRFWDDESRDPPDVAVRLKATDLVLDFDPAHQPAVKELYADARSATRCAETPHEGLHAWYTIAAPTRPVSYKGLDVLTLGRMVVVPPSRGRSWGGRPQPAALATKQEVTALVGRFVQAAGIKGLSPAESLARESLASLDPIPYHRRNHTLTAIAGVLRAAGFRGNRLTGALAGLAQYVTEQVPGDEITYDDVARICESIDWRAPRAFETSGFRRYEYNTGDAPPALRWLIRGFLPAEGVTSLFGLGKQGKSYIAMWVLRCLQTGEPFLGLETPARPVRVLYVDWEKRGASLMRRLHALARDERLPVTVMEPHGALPDMIEALRAQVAVGGFDLVIIDSLTIALMQGDVKEAFVVIPALFALNGIGVPVLALDHTKKPQMGEPYDTLTAFGSVFKGNVASMNWRLRKVSGDPLGMNIVLQGAGNNFEVDPPDIHARINFEFDSRGGLSRATVVRQAVGADASTLWRFLSYQTEPVEDTQIARVLMMTIPEVRQALTKLETLGRAAKTMENYWVVREAPEGDGS